LQPTPLDNRVVLASYSRYADAQAAVDRLSDARFPVEQVSIVGRDLRLVETVTGRLDRGRAALGGLASGAWFGLLVGLFVAIFVADDTASWLALVLWGLLFGALAGMVFSLVAYAATGGRRDFVSVSSLLAAQYDVMVDARAAEDARRVLGLAAQPAAPAYTTPDVVPAEGLDGPDRTP
jgi:heat induced stress protein YflT